MLSIGDLACRTRVSVRMLRHYAALGLIVPERIDAVTGYRWYAPSQVGRVNSLVALKELGFSLEQCRTALDDRIPVEERHGMLRLRQAELEQRIEADSGRLAEVARRIRSIERGLTMTNTTLRLGPLPALRQAQLSAEVNDTSEISAMTSTLFEALATRLTEAGLPITDGGVRTYYGRPDGSKIDIAVGVPLGPHADPVAGLELAELAAEDRAATVTYRGPAEDIADAWHTIDVALEEHGLESYGVHRQVHIDRTGDHSVVELQCPVRDSGTPSP